MTQLHSITLSGVSFAATAVAAIFALNIIMYPRNLIYKAAMRLPRMPLDVDVFFLLIKNRKVMMTHTGVSEKEGESLDSVQASQKQLLLLSKAFEDELDQHELSGWARNGTSRS